MIDTSSALLLTLLAIPGVALLAAVRLLFGGQRDASRGSMRIQLSLLGWLCIWLAIIGAVVGVCGATPIVFLLLGGVLVVGLMVWIRLRRAEHRALVGAIAVAAQRGVPTSDMARAYAGETVSGTRSRALALATMVDAGVPLDAAVVRAPLWLGTGMHVAIRTGCALGAIGPALASEMGSGREMEEAIRPLAPRLWYLAVVLNVGTGIVTFVFLKIVPIFDRMFQEFELPLPMPTILLIRVARWVVDLGPITLLMYGAIPVVLIVVTLLYIGILPRSLPLLDRLFRRYDGAIVLRNLAVAVQRGVPLLAALELVGHVYPLRSVRRWMLGAASRVAGGASWSDSLRATGLIGRVDVAVLKAAERAGNLPWAMREVADSLVRREVLRWQWCLNIAGPLVMASFGLCVALIVIPLFLPLIALIEGLSR
ncbi:MAG TPA: type II secretion system F family protein [Pirellulaceae bacterium]|nr:type II secretion system F family protein [Pirellulaceae bacterium]